MILLIINGILSIKYILDFENIDFYKNYSKLKQNYYNYNISMDFNNKSIVLFFLFK